MIRTQTSNYSTISEDSDTETITSSDVGLQSPSEVACGPRIDNSTQPLADEDMHVSPADALNTRAVDNGTHLLSQDRDLFEM